jgi:membrane protein DedA with SNARE-associated domain/membrane-associated phospholipid phosphatase
MSDNIGPLLQWLNLHPNLAGLVTFIISAAESVAIIGTIVPGTITMTAIGTLIGAGVIPLWSTFVWAILGAIAGDNISFWTGYYFKDRLRQCWPFRSYPNLLTTGEDFFGKHGRLSVLIGRFIGPTRAIVPIVAGMLRMQPLRFITVSIIASTAWAPIYMLPGILLGEATQELPPDIAAQMMLRLVLSALFIILCVWIGYRIIVLVKNQINNFLNSIWHRLLRSRYFYLITTVLKHHNIKKSHGQLILAFYLTFTAFAFAYLALYIYATPSQDIIVNNAVFYFFRSIRTPTADNIMLWITLLGDKKVLIPTIIAIFGVMAWNKRWRTAWHALALLFLTACSVVAFKYLIHSVRPWGIVNSPEDFSFPSGHTTLSTTFYVGLGLLLIPTSHIRRKWIPYLLIGTLIAAISISRLYLGAHWFTDVLGGWLLSATLLMLVVISFNRKAENKVNPAGILIAALIMITAGATIVHHHYYSKLQTSYSQAELPSHTIPLSKWWLQEHRDELPLYRIGRFGTRVDILNLQWVGSLSEIKTLLISEGWELPPERDWTGVLHRITDIGSAEHLPLVAPLYLDKKPVLVLTKNINGDKRPIVLRLWQSNINVSMGTSSSETLWVGFVGVVPRTYSWIITYKRNKDIPISSSILFSHMPTAYDIKELTVTTDLKQKSREQKILLIKPKQSS